MKVGLALGDLHTIAAEARRAEDDGFDYVGCGEHRVRYSHRLARGLQIMHTKDVSARQHGGYIARQRGITPGHVGRSGPPDLVLYTPHDFAQKSLA